MPSCVNGNGIFSSTLKGNLNGSAAVEFSAGIASFTDLSIDHEDKNYTLNIKAFTVPPSRYQFSENTDPFDVKERILALVISQQPGKAVKKVLYSLSVTHLQLGAAFGPENNFTFSLLYKSDEKISLRHLSSGLWRG